MRSDRDFDLVLVGATGFVGRLTAAHLAERGGDARIALAGRDHPRLERVRAELPGPAQSLPLVVVDVTDEAQARELAARTRVVCTTVGPYEEYGKALAAACAEAGTHYCDLVGETTFVRWSIDANTTAARRTGARIVHSCGFDSVPSDLGVLETARAAAEAGEGTLTDTVTHVRSLRGGVSGGTIASLRGQMVRAEADPAVRRLLDDPDALVADPESPTDAPAAPDTPSRPSRASWRERVGQLVEVSIDPETGRWNAPFVMAGYNTQVVRRSHAQGGSAYGPGFRYSEVTDAGSGLRGAARAVAVGLVGRVMVDGMGFAPTRAALDRLLPSPGEGPSAEARRTGRFLLEVDGTTTTGARFRTGIGDHRDPGYSSTAVMLGESALALAVDDLDEVSRDGGVHTPATALGPLLVDRLRDQGFRIESGRR